MTESSGEEHIWLAPERGFPNQGAFGIALKIHQALTAGRESAWLYWQLSEGTERALGALTDSRAQDSSPKFAAAKHFFRHIRPGARRLEVDVKGSSTLLASAYLHPGTAALTVVLINPTPAVQTVLLHSLPVAQDARLLDAWTSSPSSTWQASVVPVQDGGASVTIPGYGLVTLVGTGASVGDAGASAVPAATVLGERTEGHDSARSEGCACRRGCGPRPRAAFLPVAGGFLIPLGRLRRRHRPGKRW